MNTLYLITTILSYTICIPTLIAIIKHRQCRETCLPFFIYLVVATISEITSTLIIQAGYSNSVNANIYTLIESLIMVWLFANWRTGKSKLTYYLLCVVFTSVWILDSFVFGSPDEFNSIHRAVYAFMIVILCSDQLTFLMMNEGNVFYNPRFIICIALVVKYTYKTFSEVFVAFKPGFSYEFYEGFYLVWSVVNAITNLCFIPAVLWITRKQRYYITFS